jgi:hypothetical protein
LFISFGSKFTVLVPLTLLTLLATDTLRFWIAVRFFISPEEVKFGIFGIVAVKLYVGVGFGCAVADIERLFCRIYLSF